MEVVIVVEEYRSIIKSILKQTKLFYDDKNGTMVFNCIDQLRRSWGI